MYIPVGLIKNANNNGWIKSLSYFLKLKALYNNNTHYNYTLRSLSIKIDCSPACLQRHIKVLSSKGLITFTGKNITFVGLKKMQVLYNTNNIPVIINFKKQVQVLRSILIKFNLQSQQYVLGKSSEVNNAKGLIPFTKKEKRNSSYVGLSSFGFGKVLNCSSSSGSRIRKELHNMGLINCERVYSKLFENNVPLNTYLILKQEKAIPNYSFFREGRILVERRSRISFVW